VPLLVFEHVPVAAGEIQHVHENHFGHLRPVYAARIRHHHVAPQRACADDRVGAGRHGVDPAEPRRLREAFVVEGVAGGDDHLGVRELVVGLRQVDCREDLQIRKSLTQPRHEIFEVAVGEEYARHARRSESGSPRL
jgi:hypothetical protein